jgi:hypothetical protein
MWWTHLGSVSRLPDVGTAGRGRSGRGPEITRSRTGGGFLGMNGRLDRISVLNDDDESLRTRWPKSERALPHTSEWKRLVATCPPGVRTAVGVSGEGGCVGEVGERGVPGAE